MHEIKNPCRNDDSNDITTKIDCNFGHKNAEQMTFIQGQNKEILHTGEEEDGKFKRVGRELLTWGGVLD